jgi:hypothetical protein
MENLENMQIVESQDGNTNKTKNDYNVKEFDFSTFFNKPIKSKTLDEHRKSIKKKYKDEVKEIEDEKGNKKRKKIFRIKPKNRKNKEEEDHKEEGKEEEGKRPDEEIEATQMNKDMAELAVMGVDWLSNLVTESFTNYSLKDTPSTQNKKKMFQEQLGVCLTKWGFEFTPEAKLFVLFGLYAQSKFASREKKKVVKINDKKYNQKTNKEEKQKDKKEKEKTKKEDAKSKTGGMASII